MSSALQICFTVPIAKWLYLANVTMKINSANWSSFTIIGALLVVDAKSDVKYPAIALFKGKSKYHSVVLGILFMFILVTLQTIWRELMRPITGIDIMLK